MKEAEPIKAAVSPKRSRQSDQIPHVGAGILPDQRGADSLTRCAVVVEALFNAPRAPFSKVEKRKVTDLLSEDALIRTVVIYWDDHDYDRRTKDSDLKRELGKVVTHLRALNKAMDKIPKQTADIINYLIHKPKLPGLQKIDVFTAALQANATLLEYCGPLVEGTHGKDKRLSTVNLAAAMMVIWERLSGEKFRANTKKIKVKASHSLIRDLHEFQGRGPHFVHVMLQAIDPAITQSMVESSIKTLSSNSGRKTDPKIER